MLSDFPREIVAFLRTNLISFLLKLLIRMLVAAPLAVPGEFVLLILVLRT